MEVGKLQLEVWALEAYLDLKRAQVKEFAT
jgi:hypothetical protein